MKTSNALTSHSTAKILQIDWIVQFFAESEESDYHLFSEPQDILKWAQSLHPIFFFYSSSSMLPSNKTVAMPGCYSKRKPPGSSDWSTVLELTLISVSCFFSFTWHGVKLKDEVQLEKKRAHPMVIHVHLARLRRKTNGKVVYWNERTRSVWMLQATLLQGCSIIAKKSIKIILWILRSWLFNTITHWLWRHHAFNLLFLF